MNAHIAGHVRTRPAEHWFGVFDEVGIWYAPVNSYEDVEEDPQVVHNQAIMTFEHPRAGTVRVLSPPRPLRRRRRAGASSPNSASTPRKYSPSWLRARGIEDLKSGSSKCRGH